MVQRMERGEPALLLRGSQTHPDEIGSDPVQFIEDTGIVIPEEPRQIATTMERADDAQGRVQGREALHQSPTAGLRPAQQVVRESGRRMDQRMAEESRAVHAVFHAGSGGIQEPEEG